MAFQYFISTLNCQNKVKTKQRKTKIAIQTMANLMYREWHFTGDTTNCFTKIFKSIQEVD